MNNAPALEVRNLHVSVGSARIVISGVAEDVVVLYGGQSVGLPGHDGGTHLVRSFCATSGSGRIANAWEAARVLSARH